MTDKVLGWIGLAVLAVVMTVLTMQGVIEYNVAKGLPVPPDLTPAEMRQREIDYVGDHLKTCERCGPATAETVFYCNEYIRLTCEAKTVGDWCMFGYIRQTNQVLWRYVGRPRPGWVWSELLQCWRQVRNYR